MHFLAIANVHLQLISYKRSVHSFNGDYLSIAEGTGSCGYLFHEIPGTCTRQIDPIKIYNIKLFCLQMMKKGNFYEVLRRMHSLYMLRYMYLLPYFFLWKVKIFLARLLNTFEWVGVCMLFTIKDYQNNLNVSLILAFGPQF